MGNDRFKFRRSLLEATDPNNIPQIQALSSVLPVFDLHQASFESLNPCDQSR